MPPSKSNARRSVNLPGRPPDLPFPDAVLVGDTLYLSGRIGVDAKSLRPPERLEDEIRLLFDGFEAVLAQADMTMDDLAYVQIFSPDVSLWTPFNAAYRKRFRRDFPARAFIGSGPLLFGGHFEMIGIAVRSSSSRPSPAKRRRCK